MSISIVWIDREHAKLFQLSNEKMERKHLESRHQDHHTHRLDNLDQNDYGQAFFSQVVAELADPLKILILGPGVGKHHFQNYLTEHWPLFAKRVVGCEAVDHPTDPQIAALAKKFFGTTLRQG